MRTIWLLLLCATTASAANMVSIPDGSFAMGCSPNDKHCERDESPAVKVTVPTFFIDAHEVTVAEYKTCVAKGPCQAPKTHARNEYCNYDAPGRGGSWNEKVVNLRASFRYSKPPVSGDTVYGSIGFRCAK